MKKIISLVLALVFMLSICTPAFALDMTTPSGSTTVKVLGASASATYTVTIPATVTIPWGKTESDIEYSVYSQLETDYYVTVTVEADSDGKMKNSSNTAFLEYSLKDGTTEYITTSSVISADSPEKASVVVSIPDANWEKASIDNYTGTLTFSAEILEAEANGRN